MFGNFIYGVNALGGLPIYEVVLLQTIYPSGIISLEIFGTTKLNFVLVPIGITSSELFGTSKLNFKIFPVGIWEEAFGTSKLNFKIYPASVLSEEIFGINKLNFKIFPVGIWEEAFGVAKLNRTIRILGIVTSEIFGTFYLIFTYPDLITEIQIPRVRVEQQLPDQLQIEFGEPSQTIQIISEILNVKAVIESFSEFKEVKAITKEVWIAQYKELTLWQKEDLI